MGVRTSLIISSQADAPHVSISIAFTKTRHLLINKPLRNKTICGSQTQYVRWNNFWHQRWELQILSEWCVEMISTYMHVYCCCCMGSLQGRLQNWSWRHFEKRGLVAGFKKGLEMIQRTSQWRRQSWRKTGLGDIFNKKGLAAGSQTGLEILEWTDVLWTSPKLPG